MLTDLLLLVLWIAVVTFWWQTRRQIEEMRQEIHDLAARLGEQSVRQ